MKCDTVRIAQYSNTGAKLSQFLQDTAWVVVPSVTVIIGLIQLAKNSTGDARTWRCIKMILDDFRQEIFADCPATHDHRVTLFQHNDFCLCWQTLSYARWPTTGCLIPVERSGDVTQNPSIVFRAPKDEPQKADGIAGLVWQSRECQYISNLPDLSPSSSNKTFLSYASKTRGNARQIRRRTKRGKKYARSYWGIPVEVQGRLWGVVLIDSRGTTIANSDNIKNTFNRHAKTLNVLLQNL